MDYNIEMNPLEKIITATLLLSSLLYWELSYGGIKKVSNRTQVGVEQSIVEDLQTINTRLEVLNKECEGKADTCIGMARTLYDQSIRIKEEVRALPNLEERNSIIGTLSSIESSSKRILNTASLSTFSKEIENEIRDILIDRNENKKDLWMLRTAAKCLDSDNNVNYINGFLSDLFEHIFEKYSTLDQLTQDDCTVLKKAYSLWASNYEFHNRKMEEKQNQPDIPLYNVNAHNDSFAFWVKEMKSGNIAKEGIPLIHADTHTDMGHVHNHIMGSTWHSGLNFKELGEALKVTDDQQFKLHIQQLIQSNNLYGSAIKQEMSELISSLSSQELRHQLEDSARRRVHKISQPVTGAAAIGITNKVVMCLPPWSPRLKINTKDQPITDAKVNLHRNQIGFCTRDRQVARHRGSPIRYCLEDERVLAEVGIGVMECNDEAKEESGFISNRTPSAMKDIPRFVDFLEGSPPEQGFILDIDLDVFASNGVGTGDYVEPISYARSGEHLKQFGEHEPHDQSNETDPQVQVLATELNLVDKRIDYLFENLKEAKEKGYLPKVVTIADSTLLARAAESSVDSNNGGNFTPACLSFLLNYKVRQKLNDLYNIRTIEN
ncbi:MAG: hypothetical protein CL677_07960 [Bdellovibrionaceae bacterium]|nr:hypothetical protein [Pseudobdellovibrionaceae bacterium]|tara:strand:- start:74078 stop:75895 length:1818 start_codon:yes stop_codon:yes gene_type:complete